MRRRYATADVFTSKPLGGNPVAVVLDAAGLTTAQMQALAAEFNYVETTFVLPPASSKHTAHVRIFTPDREVPFAGHPNIGTAFLLARERASADGSRPEQFVFEEAAGLVEIDLLYQDGIVVGANLCAPQSLTRRAEVEAAHAAACLSLTTDDVKFTRHKPQIVSVGLPFLAVELVSREALRRARPNRQAYDDLFPLDDGRCCMDRLAVDIWRPIVFRIFRMPHKLNRARRHKIAKQKRRVTNWAGYNESLRRRGDLTVWISEDVQCLWSASQRKSRGGQQKYSDLAITLCLTLRVVYHLPLRQTQGLMRSLAALMGLDVPVPDFSTLSRRSKGLALPPTKARLGKEGPVHLVIDSTGLKIVGAGEWLETKHAAKASRKRWRKLHLGLDLMSGEIICSELTTDEIGDPTALPDLLDQIENPVARVIADGAYDGARTRDLLGASFGDNLDVVIPPPRNAVASPDAATHPTVRDRHIADIGQRGRWRGRNRRVTISAAGSRPRWAGGRQSSGRNYRRGTSTIRRPRVSVRSGHF